MTIDIFTSAGEKSGTLDLPAELFEAPVNRTLIHQAILRQQSNARNAIAHAKNRGEVTGSSRKLYGQKHTGNARRGNIRSPLLRGGGKAFGPRNVANFEKDMPRSMRRAALAAILSYQAKKHAIMGLKSYPDTIKTKAVKDLLGKMKLADSRGVLFVLPERHDALWLSARNLVNVKTVLVSYLNPVDVAHARAIVFVGDSVERAMKLFGKKNERTQKRKMGDVTTEKQQPSDAAKPSAAAKTKKQPSGAATGKKKVGVKAAKKTAAKAKKSSPKA